jgi:exopolyphosphatase/guanosine-5'-triphosphate,3'-diphosphate pyrophosphatase
MLYFIRKILNVLKNLNYLTERRKITIAQLKAVDCNLTKDMKQVIIFLLVFVSVFSYADIVRRACFDIGSGSTKMVVADVDTVKHTIEIVYEENAKVDYKGDLEKSADNRFSDKILEQGLKVLNELAQKAHQKGAKQFAGVATAAFRTSDNGKEYLNQIEDKLGICVSLISQKEEAEMGFMAACQGEDNKDIAVWDIGGGSMQISCYNKDHEFKVYEGQFASNNMKSFLINLKQTANLNTPNPVGGKNAKAGLKYVKELARQIEPEIKEALKNAHIIGIGGVHYYSVCPQINKELNKHEKSYTVDDLKETLKKRYNKTDEELGGDYADTEVGNLILVLGYMKTLGIKQVQTKKINMAHGLLCYEKLWK